MVPGSSTQLLPDAPLTDAEAAPARRDRALFSGLRTVAALTLLSRILGLVRNIAMATLFGNGLVMDAFSIAFRIPNLARSLFGEGALTAAFLPVFVGELQKPRRESAWRLASALLIVLAVGLSVLVLVAEIVLWGASHVWTFSHETQVLVKLLAVMLPYLVLICLAAQVSTMMQALGHFTWPALLPVILNVLWIGSLWWIVPVFGTPDTQITVTAAAVVVGGIVQLAAPLPKLHRLGFRFDRAWRVAWPQVALVATAVVPVILGLAITQLNTLADSLVAWTFSQPESGAATMNLFGHPRYPLAAGTASALYFGQRMYQFPLGVFGVALGTVMFPLLSAHAQRGRLDLLRSDLVLGLKLVLIVGLPASLGLCLLSRELTVAVFQHGRFDANDVAQTVGITAAYSAAVWAYCGLLIVNRGFYAVGDRITPLRVGLATVLLNVCLNLTLIWFLGGWGLALATAVASVVQLAGVTWLIQRRVGQIDWRGLSRTGLRTVIATAAMGAVCWGVLWLLPSGAGMSLRLLRVAAPVAASLLAYGGLAWLLGLDELWLLFRRDARDAESARAEIDAGADGIAHRFPLCEFLAIRLDGCSTAVVECRLPE